MPYTPNKAKIQTRNTAEVWVDFSSVENLANRAALNKSGKAKAGPVTVQIVKRVETEK